MAIRTGKSSRSARLTSVISPYSTKRRTNTGKNKRVYVGNLSYDVSWQDLKDHFRSVGAVTRADIAEERNGRSKGFGLLEFATAEDAMNAIETMNEAELKGRIIFVREDRGDVSKDSQSTSRRAKTSPILSTSFTRVYVGNLSYETSWQDLKDFFRQAGEVVRADILEGRDGRSRGCGIVEFSTTEEAQCAIETLNNAEVQGRPIFVREDKEQIKLGVGREDSHTAMQLQHHVDAALPSQRGSTGRTVIATSNTTSKPKLSTLVTARRIYVGNLSYSVSWQDLKDHFKPIGNVLRADVFEEAGGRSKGCGLVEFSTAEEAQRAIETLNDSELQGRLIFVREDRDDSAVRVDTKKHPPLGSAISRHTGGNVQSVGASCRLYVGNLAWDATWMQLKDHFRIAGEVVRADVIAEPSGRSRGFGIVEMATVHDAAFAIEKLNNSHINGRQIYVREDREEAK